MSIDNTQNETIGSVLLLNQPINLLAIELTKH
jgi:hypothetical protein